MEPDKAAATLAELFPAVAQDVIGDVLAQHAYQLEDAISSLLVITSASPEPQAPSGAPSSVSHKPSQQQPRRQQQQQGSVKKAPAASWGSLGPSPDLRQKFHISPSYNQGGGRAAAMPPAEAEFPAALPSSLGPARSPARAANSQWPAADGTTPPASHDYLSSASSSPSRPAVAWATVARSPTRAISGGQHAAAHVAAQQARHATAQHQQRAAGGQSEGEADWQQEVAQQLSQQHPWAGRDLVGSVLAAVAFDLKTAQAILGDMEHPATGSGAGLADGSEEASGVGSSSEEEQQQQQEQRQRFLDAGDFAVAGAPQKAAGGPRPGRSLQRPLPGAAKTSRGSSPEPAAPETQARPARYVDSRGAGKVMTRTNHPSSSDSSRDASPSAAHDVYWRHRGDALRLTRAWQKAVSKAASAYGGGNHGKAQRLAAEARHLREASLAAHEQAASRIEAELNADASLFELDLHGLHAAEAVAALMRRLELLQQVLADATSRRLEEKRGRSRDSSSGRQPPAPARAAGSAVAAGAAEAAAAAEGGAAGGAGAPPLRPASPAQPSGLSGRVPATGRWELQVVVGRGAHSSGGEATIPRAVEARLAELGYKFERRGAGALDVALRRPFGGLKTMGKPQRR
ncbi:hypothetical protein N2152v2_008197 [Parachlorella kessleri]